MGISMATAAVGTGGTRGAQHCPWRAREEGKILSALREALHLGSWSRIRRWERLGPGGPFAADPFGKAGLEGCWSSFACHEGLSSAPEFQVWQAGPWPGGRVLKALCSALEEQCAASTKALKGKQVQKTV